MLIRKAKDARARLQSYKPVYCLFIDADNRQQRWQLAQVQILRRKPGFVRVLSVTGREADLLHTDSLFDDGSR